MWLFQEEAEEGWAIGCFFCEFRGGEKAIHFGRASFVILLIRISFSLSILLAELRNGEVEEGREKGTWGRGEMGGWRSLGRRGKGFLEEKGGGLADGGIEKAYFASLLRFLAVSIEKETSIQGWDEIGGTGWK